MIWPFTSRHTPELIRLRSDNASLLHKLMEAERARDDYRHGMQAAEAALRRTQNTVDLLDHAVALSITKIETLQAELAALRVIAPVRGERGRWVRKVTS